MLTMNSLPLGRVHAKPREKCRTEKLRPSSLTPLLTKVAPDQDAAMAEILGAKPALRAFFPAVTWPVALDVKHSLDMG
jgi:hypothetical protein